MKKLIIALSAVVLSLALFGCASSGSGGGSSASSASDTKTEQAEPAAPASKDGGVDVAVEKYGLDLEGSNDWTPMATEKPLSVEDLGKLYGEQIKLIPAGTMTYDEVVAVFGAEPNEFNPAINAPAITFEWVSSDSTAKYVRVTFTQDDDGVWKNQYCSITNIPYNTK